MAALGRLLGFLTTCSYFIIQYQLATGSVRFDIWWPLSYRNSHLIEFGKPEYTAFRNCICDPTMIDCHTNLDMGVCGSTNKTRKICFYKVKSGYPTQSVKLPTNQLASSHVCFMNIKTHHIICSRRLGVVKKICNMSTCLSFQLKNVDNPCDTNCRSATLLSPQRLRIYYGNDVDTECQPEASASAVFTQETSTSALNATVLTTLGPDSMDNISLTVLESVNKPDDKHGTMPLLPGIGLIAGVSVIIIIIAIVGLFKRKHTSNGGPNDDRHTFIKNEDIYFNKYARPKNHGMYYNEVLNPVTFSHNEFNSIRPHSQNNLSRFENRRRSQASLDTDIRNSRNMNRHAVCAAVEARSPQTENHYAKIGDIQRKMIHPYCVLPDPGEHEPTCETVKNLTLSWSDDEEEERLKHSLTQPFVQSPTNNSNIQTDIFQPKKQPITNGLLVGAMRRLSAQGNPPPLEQTTKSVTRTSLPEACTTSGNGSSGNSQIYFELEQQKGTENKGVHDKEQGSQIYYVLENNIGELEIDGDGLESNAAQLERDYDELESNAAQLERDYDELESNVAEVESDVDELEINDDMSESDDEGLDRDGDYADIESCGEENV